MNLIKRHKGLAIICLLTLVLVLVMFAIFARMIFSTGDSEYGTRLKDLTKLDKNITKEIIEELEGLEIVEDASIRTQGKIIYTTIVFKEGTNKDKAKEIANNTISKYTEAILADYDFGYFLKENIEPKEDEETKTGFVIAGTKHPDTKVISWTKQ